MPFGCTVERLGRTQDVPGSSPASSIAYFGCFLRPGGSTDDAGIVSYAWSEAGTGLGSSGVANGVSAVLSLGIHTLQLLVTDGGGLTDTDTADVVVEDRFYPNHSSGTAAVVTGR